MKIYIVADMEGISGVVCPEQINGNQAWDSDRVRRKFTEEVCAVCQAAKEAGCEEIIVNDFHGNGRNILAEKLPPEVFLVQGDFRSTSGYDLLDGTFGGLIILGAHARSATREAVMPHTYTSRARFEIYGQQMGEIDILSLLAGEAKVPTILISGDSKTVEQARNNLPATPTVVTKFAIGKGAALCFHPMQVIESLKEETKRAIQNVATIEPPQLNPPIQFVMRLQSLDDAEKIEWIPGLKRTSDTVFEFAGENMRQVAKLIFGVTCLLEK